jgi:hypothetical protein
VTDIWLSVKDFYWAHRELFGLAGAGLVFVCAQFVILLWTLRRLGELGALRERISRLADGLALLTDTTEAGMAALAAELQQTNRTGRTTKAATRATVQKRVKEAARQGERISKIAAHEALSESEVRLHLALSGRDRTNGRTTHRADGAGIAEPLIAS